MKKDDLEAIFARIRTWAPEWQEYTAGSLLSIEFMMTHNGRKYLMTEEEMADLQAALVEDDELAFKEEDEPATGRGR